MRKRKLETRFVVTKTTPDGTHVLECRLAKPSETGLGTNVTYKTGLLVPLPAGTPTDQTFATEAHADRYINKTKEAIALLRGSMVEEHPRLRLLLTPGAFGLRTITK